MRCPSILWPTATVILTVLAAAPVRAQTPELPNHLYDRFQFSASGTTVWLGSTIRVDASDGTPGTEFKPEDAGAGNQVWEPRLAVRWRPGRRHELEASYLFARSSGSRTLADTIAFADTTFPAGGQVNSAFKSDQASLTYRFAFHAGERSQIGAALGLGALLVNIDLEALPGAGGSYSASKSVTAPTGSVGLYGRWRAGDRWYIESDARALYVKIDRIHATVVEAGAAARYFLSRHIGFELGYGLTGIKVILDPRASGSGLSGQLRYTLQNLRLGVIATP